MADLVLTHIGDTALDGLSYRVMVAEGVGPLAATVDVRERAGAWPTRDTWRGGARDLPLVAWAEGDTPSLNEFRAALAALLPAGQRVTLRATWHRGPGDDLALWVPADVLSVGFEAGQRQAAIALRLPDPAWRHAEAQTDDSGTATVNGNTSVPARLTIGGGASVARYRVIARDRTGRGMFGFPAPVLTLPDHDPQDIIVYQAGRSVPFWYDATSGKLWVRLDCNPAATVALDIYAGAAVANDATAQRLDLGGLDPAASSLADWRWPGGARARSGPNATGIWTLGRTVVHRQRRQYTYTYNAIHPDSWGTDTPQALADDYDSQVLVTGVEAVSLTTSGSAGTPGTWHLKTGHYEKSYQVWRWDNMTETGEWVNQTDEWDLYTDWHASAGLYSYGRHAGQEGWGMPVAGAVELAIAVIPGLEGGHTINPTGDPPGEASGDWERLVEEQWRCYITSTVVPTRVVLDSERVPSLDVVGPLAARRRDTVVRNTTTGGSLQLVAVYSDDVDLVLDLEAGQALAAESGPWYREALRFSDDARLFALAPGANTWTATDPVQLQWFDREVL